MTESQHGTPGETDHAPRHAAGAEDPSEVWESRYRERDQIWSGEPNAALTATVVALEPGRALDLGCGEGGDSVWLAGQGWQVTAVDISATAIARAAARARDREIPDERIAWLVEDLATWRPSGSYDLVSACFLHSPLDFPRADVLRRAAATVPGGGHLLIVGHADPPPWAAEHAHPVHAFPGRDEQIAELQLGPGAWETVVSETRSRDATGPDGQRALLRDHVILLRRRA